MKSAQVYVDKNTGVMYVDQSEILGTGLLWKLAAGSIRRGNAMRNKAKEIAGNSTVASVAGKATKKIGDNGMKRAVSQNNEASKSASGISGLFRKAWKARNENKIIKQKQTAEEHNKKVALAEKERNEALANNSKQINKEQANEQANADNTTTPENNEDTSGPLTAEQFEANEQENQKKADEYQKFLDEQEAQNQREEKAEAKRLQQEQDDEKLTEIYWQRVVWGADNNDDLNEKIRAASDEKKAKMNKRAFEKLDEEKGRREKSKITCTVCMKCASQYT